MKTNSNKRGGVKNAKDNYNKIFEDLVEDEGNLIGLIAYGLYKQEKRKEVVKIKESGRSPAKAEIKRIESVLSNQLETFKDQANELLNVTFEYLIEENKEKIYCQYFRQEDIERLSKRPNFRKRLLENLLFRLIWLVLIGAIGYVIYVNSDTLKAIGEKVAILFF
ncbi:MAG: hypothetical protein GDA51_04980 [Ekhidna sp.]|nr:hypothetical protein [Ekhidna sp.]MBC6410997.1 hypothetical protein [Ekhidna sp.]MBC6425819.1 hypothetical protein [Ekhidna sp.]